MLPPESLLLAVVFKRDLRSLGPLLQLLFYQLKYSYYLRAKKEKFLK